jgi:hypothetical protein
MTRERYSQWIAVWKWFQTQPRRTHSLEHLYGMLNEMWQRDRASTPPDLLASFSQPLGIENDPKFRKFLDDLNKGFQH